VEMVALQACILPLFRHRCWVVGRVSSVTRQTRKSGMCWFSCRKNQRLPRLGEGPPAVTVCKQPCLVAVSRRAGGYHRFLIRSST
jgi:hypothetical protein